ncbi:FtsX-like permease family protein, partial [uncultured Clostridium sp.]|uniref:FtsX-like permease family protein n=1 Tax=uncultured Clostridium sp. TaxID=59620 RepID=UPI00261219DF
MYFKLALKNVKRSIKDYSVYFFTLILSITIFYSFNSIEAQKVMLDLTKAEGMALEMVNTVMGIFSFTISGVLVFLILYANRYLIKRRKKEFGIYLTIGMERGTVAKVLFYETLIVGFFSLLIGIIIGIFVSQGLGIFTAKLFDTTIVDFTFIVSISGILKTVICFVIIYILVLIFNSFSMRKITIIKLIRAKNKNENFILKNIWVSVILFLISIAMIGVAYQIALKEGIAILGEKQGIAIALGVVGTFFMFFSLAGFFLKIFQSIKSKYFTGLNSFILRQISSKMNSTFISMAVISLMLFVAICTLAGGFGINNAIRSNLESLTNFDIMVSNYYGNNINNILKDNKIDISKYSDSYASVGYYNSDVKYSDLLSVAQRENEELKNYAPISTDRTIKVITQSDINGILKILGKKQVEIKNNQYMLLSDVDAMKEPLKKVILDNKVISVAGKNLSPAKSRVINDVINIGMIKSNIAVIVVNDSVVKGEKAEFTNLLIKNAKDLDSLTEKLHKLSQEHKDGGHNNISIKTKDRLVASSTMLGISVSYVGIYIGFIFTIAAAGILSIQQLSEVSDNIERYRVLGKIGVDKKMIKKSILVQIGIYFFIPLLIGIIHSIVGLEISAGVVAIFGEVNFLDNIFISVGVLLVVYIGYFIMTYINAKNTIVGKIK